MCLVVSRPLLLRLRHLRDRLHHGDGHLHRDSRLGRIRLRRRIRLTHRHLRRHLS